MDICFECHNNNSCEHNCLVKVMGTCERCGKWRRVVLCYEPFGFGSSTTDEKKESKSLKE